MIIKNCPAYRTECEEIFNFLGSEKIFNACLKSAGISCKDITNCLLKRIADKCGYTSPDGGFNDSEAQDLANGIIDLLEIEECE